MARVLLRGEHAQCIGASTALHELSDELEEIEVGPERRRLSEPERRVLARKLLKL